MNRFLSNFFFVAGFVFLGLAGYCYFAPAARPSLDVPSTDIDVGGCPAGREKEIAVKVHNISSKPLRVLGLAEC